MASPDHDQPNQSDVKNQQLDTHARVSHEGSKLTTDQGVRVDHTDDALSVGNRGPTLLEDFHFREKLTRFDHERIPERVVHARGAGAYGYFECYESQSNITQAHFLGAAGRRTPVFVRFSTVAGSRGSADTVRDVRGFATKFYTEQGNYDLVGNNFPVFFIQDGIKFPDFVHAVKPEPHNEIPQAASAHNTFWDFVSLTPETLHMVMWLMSDRALPRSYRMMQGFGVHTFRFVNADGVGTFVKFHWRPALGTHSLVWDETQKIAGKDADFNRRDLWEAIDTGNYPEYELCVQLVSEQDEHSFDFDLLDATKIIPEEEVPVRPIGKMVLNRNPDNFFAETEQVAFHTANVVPGIDFTNDPLLQARNFSYLDTQLIRLGGPNFSQLPINRPVAEVHNDQRDGYGQHRIDRSTTSYFPNSLSGGCPAIAGTDEGAFSHYTERVDGHKIRERSPSFADHYSQATLFWNSMTSWERQHIVDALSFELGKVDHPHIHERMLEHLGQIDGGLASRVGANLGLQAPTTGTPHHDRSSPALSQAEQPASPQSRKVAVLAADGVDAETLQPVLDRLDADGAICEVLAPHAGQLVTAADNSLTVDRQIETMSAVLYDAVLVAGGWTSAETLREVGEAVHYVAEAYRHAKPVGALHAGVRVLEQAPLPGARLATGADGVVSEQGVITTVADATSSSGIPAGGADSSASGHSGPAAGSGADPTVFAAAFAEALGRHRYFERDVAAVPA